MGAAESTALRDVLTCIRDLERWAVMAAPCTPAEEARFVALAKVLRVTLDVLRRTPDGALLLLSVTALCWREAIAAALHRHEASDAISR